MAEENTQTDFEKVQQVIRQQVDEYMQQSASRQPSQQQPSAEEQQQRQIGDTVRGFVAPDINEARFTAADARDYTDFYTGADPLTLLYREEVEKNFRMMKEAGRPTVRKDLLRHIVGSDYMADPEKFSEKQAAIRQAQLDRAHAAADAGGGSGTKEKADRFANIDSMSLEELEKALDGVVF